MLDEINVGIRLLHEKMDGQVKLLERLTDPRLFYEQENFAQTIQASRQREIRLTQAILSAVTVLEETRKNFRSKQLEQLRRHLVEVLGRTD